MSLPDHLKVLLILNVIARLSTQHPQATAINGHLLTVLEELKECRSVIVDKVSVLSLTEA